MNPETTAGNRGIADLRIETMTTGKVAEYLELASRGRGVWLAAPARYPAR